MPYKHDYDKILTRLIRILSRLNDGEALSVKELAKEFGVSERTIRRDFNERLISFPIYQDNKKWKMQENFRLEKITSLEDAVVLNILEGLIESNGNNKLFASKAKNLLSKLKNQEFNPIFTKLDLEDISDKLNEIQQLTSAIKNRHLITCNYRFENIKKRLKIKPLKIANYEGFWYLVALDAKNDKLKKFYLKNINSISQCEEKFTTDNQIEKTLDNSVSVWFDEKNSPFKVTLIANSSIAKYFLRKPISKTQKNEEILEDGSLKLSVMITHKMEIIPIIKYWIPHVRLIEPLEIKEEIEKDFQEYLRY
jgi:predicted DNA-binding transcriptional regulator YafY